MIDLDAELPPIGERRVAVHVTNDALRQVRGGHPWVWDGSVTRSAPVGAAGDLAVVFDDKRRFAAIGLWDPGAAIAVRILHTGSPVSIDESFLGDALLTAIARRQPLVDDPTITGYRLVHGENDRLPGLVVDRYEDTLVVKLDSVVWVPHLRTVVPLLVELIEPDRVVVRASRRCETDLPAALRDSPTVFGSESAGPVRFLEHGLEFEADVERGQKTGHFLDQRNNRRLIGERCRDASVLDVFCNTGGFSVHAAAGGARSVLSIDVSSHAISATERHMALNRSRFEPTLVHEAWAADAFEAMAELIRDKRRFDVVIVDPPSFAPNAAAVPAALRAYRRLTAMATDLMADGGTLFQASCSSRIDPKQFGELVMDEIRRQGYRPHNSIRTGHALDHPIGFSHGAYLKAIVTEIESVSSG